MAHDHNPSELAPLFGERLDRGGNGWRIRHAPIPQRHR